MYANFAGCSKFNGKVNWLKMSWWQNGVIYQVYPRSFFDSNDDGMGDLSGVTEKLPYLKKLGVDAIWLSPFYPSPLHDGGYDVANPRDVAPELGGLQSFDQLSKKAKECNIKIIVDLVPNHFSKEHPWFKQALLSEPNSDARRLFHFRDGKGNAGQFPPNNWISLFGGPAWTRVVEADGKPGQWYLHIFDASQPDLNWSNSQIRSDFKETINFWLNRGVSGFRIDVAVGLIKDMSYQDDPEPQLRVDAMRLDLYDPENPQRSDEIRKWAKDSPLFDRDEVHQIYQEWRELFKDRSDDVFAVAEAWAYPVERAMAYAKSLGQVFNFDFMIVPFKSATLSQTINQLIAAANEYQTFPTWVLSNHDVSRIVTRLGGGELGRAKARAMATLTHFLPGSIYVYQGEELGLPDANIAPELRLDPIWEKSGHTQIGRDGCRAPIPWNSKLPNRGFSKAFKTWLPSPADWVVEDVPTQEADPSSTLWLYRKLINLRKSHQLWQVPIDQVSASVNGHLLVVWRAQLGVCLVNTGDQPIAFEMPCPMQVLVQSNQLKVELDEKAISVPGNTAIILEKVSTKT